MNKINRFFKVFITLSVMTIGTGNIYSQNMVVSTTQTAAQLVNNVLLGGGVTAGSITYTGSATSKGSFTTGSSIGFLMDEGIILTSGAATDVPGWNTSGATSTSAGGQTDADLSALISGSSSITDATILEFDFVPISDTIKFDYIFASEEYPEFACGNFNDVFAFFLSGPNPLGGNYVKQNLALITGTNTYVGVNTINNGTAGTNGNAANCTAIDANWTSYSQYYNDNPKNANIIKIKPDGYTDIFTARAAVVIGQTYHIKLAIADVSDDGFDSYVFIKARSFSSPSLTLNLAATPDTICPGAQVKLRATVANGTPNYTYNWSTGVTHTNSTLLVDSIFVNPTVSTNYIVTVTDNDGASLTDTVRVVVMNSLNVTISGTATICNGASTTLTASGASNYLWNNGLSTNPLTVSPSTSTWYRVTGTSSGCTDTASIYIAVNPVPNVAINGLASICGGNSTVLTASGATNYTWNNSSTNSSLTINPTANTTYSVIGITSGCSDTATFNILVVTPPIVSITGVDSICGGSSTTLTALGATSYLWSNGVSINSNLVTPLINTTYSVIGTTSGCSDTATILVVIKNIPIASITGTNTICRGDSTTLVAHGGNSYLWNNNSILSSIRVSPINSSNYNVIVNSNGCLDTAFYLVTVNLIPVVSIGGDSSICNGSSTSLTANGATSYQWSNGIGTAVNAVSPSLNTTYTVIGTSLGCKDTVSIQVVVKPNPIVSITGINSICVGNSTNLQASGANSYLWNTGFLTNTTSVAPIVNTTYNVIGTTNGCSDTAFYGVQVKMLPVLTIQGSNHLCIGDSITLNASGADNYLWSPSASLSATTGSVVVSNPINNIQYTLVGNLNGCVDSIFYPITVNPIPTIQIQSNIQSGCEPLMVSFNISSTPQAQSAVWTFGNSTTSTSLTPNAYYLNDGIFDVTLSITDVNGCKNNTAENQFITVYPKPVVYFTFSPSPGMVNEPVTFTSTSTENPVLWSWNFGDGNSTTNTVPVETYTYLSSRNFTVTHYVETINGCRDTISKTVTVITRLIIPNVMTPNGDGANDYFFIDGLQFLENCELKIYNRWGGVIYKSENYQNNWDGEGAADGTYFYILTVPDFLQTGPFSGSITLFK